MEVQVRPGKYVVAVSGGVDSVVLLHVLQQKDLDLVVAHFDHGIRENSADDRIFVAKLAEEYGLPFIYETVSLGKEASEATARKARYDFLRKTKLEEGAQAIITAHHQDDVLETALLNLLRGTGRKGLSSLQTTSEITRPLVAVPKAELITYALQHNLSWQEDSTNYDQRYTRNYIRHRVLAHAPANTRQQLLATVQQATIINTQLDNELQQYLATQPAGKLERLNFIKLPHDISKEVLAAWLRVNGVREFDRRTLMRLAVHLKTLPPGKQLDVTQGVSISIGQEHLALRASER